MNSYLIKPVSILYGLGNKPAKSLKKISIYTVGDLLRVTSVAIHKALKDTIKIPVIESWRSQANLLQTTGMTPVIANILVKGGIANVQYLSLTKFSNLKTILTAGAGGGAIPDDDQIVFWLTESTVICTKGSVCGTVTDVHSKPIKNAEVKIGKISDLTDSRGRFRLIKIPFRPAEKLVISHSNFFDFTVNTPSISSGYNTIDIQPFKLKIHFSRKKKKLEIININEYLGEEIESPQNYKRTSVDMKKQPLRPNDVFVVRTISEKTKDATLVSRFREVKNDKLQIYTWKVASSQLPRKAGEGSVLRYSGGKFVLTSFNKGIKEFMMKSKRAAQMLPAKYKKPTRENVIKAFNEYLKLQKHI
ncbi:MAG: DUF4332 domain-containing protein [Ignavibacteria bacterium]